MNTMCIFIGRFPKKAFMSFGAKITQDFIFTSSRIKFCTILCATKRYLTSVTATLVFSSYGNLTHVGKSLTTLNNLFHAHYLINIYAVLISTLID